MPKSFEELGYPKGYRLVDVEICINCTYYQSHDMCEKHNTIVSYTSVCDSWE